MAFSHFESVSIFDGTSWVSTTVNTVVYGDVLAHTNAGKLLSMLLQWTGNVILALLIGGIVAAAQRMLLETPADIKQDLDEIEKEVEEAAEDVRHRRRCRKATRQLPDPLGDGQGYTQGIAEH